MNAIASENGGTGATVARKDALRQRAAFPSPQCFCLSMILSKNRFPLFGIML
jgi:hypothetical protein